jgi:hypothetical protein
MRGWKTTLKRKKIQRHINIVLRAMNRNLENDPLWLGRFYAHQEQIMYEMSEDGSYCYARVIVKLTDRKTGKFAFHYFHKEDFMGSTWRIWEAMNKFIVEYCKVWEEDPRPSVEDPWDYRKVGKK